MTADDLAQASFALDGAAEFDYGVLDDVTARTVQLAAERIRLRLKRTAEDIVAIGQDLITVKARVGRGQFLAWLKSELLVTEKTADRFMCIAERFGDDFDNLSKYSPSILYLLSEPQHVRDGSSDAVIAQLESGAVDPTVAAVKAALAEEKAKTETEIARATALQAQLMTQQTEAAQRQEALRAELTAALQNANARAAALTQTIDALKQEIATPAPPREVPTPDPADRQRIAALESDQQILRQRLVDAERQRKEAADHSRYLQEQLTAETQKHFAGEADQRVRREWFTHSGEALTLLRKVATLLPAPGHLAAFQPDDWQRLDDLKQQMVRLTAALDDLQHDIVIDAGE